MSRIGRNDPCPCGSGLKYKKCCLKEERPNVLSLDARRLRKIEDRLAGRMLDHMKKVYGQVSVWMAQYEYFCWPDEIPDDEAIEHEIAQAFTPWFIYNWEPDPMEFEEALDDWETAELPPMENPAQHFLRTQRNKLTAEERSFIELSCAAQFSFLKVLDVRREQGMDIEDMLTGERHFIQDISISRTAFDGMIIFARVIKASEQTAILAGSGMTALPPAYTDDIIELRDHMRKGMESLARESRAGRMKLSASDIAAINVLKDYDLEIRERYHLLAEMIRHPAPPIMQNTDGDDIVPLRLVYEFVGTPREALDKLATLCDGQTSAQLLESMNPTMDPSGELQAIDFPWLVKRPATAMMNNTVNGQLSIRGNVLSIDVNSRERAEAVQRKITRRLGKNAALLSIDEQSSAAPPAGSSFNDLSDAEKQELLNSPEVRQRIEAMSQQHWAQWLDDALPALHGQTPREAARTPKGRELLEALFDEFAFRDEQAAQHDITNSFKAPIGALRKELGLA